MIYAYARQLKYMHTDDHTHIHSTNIHTVVHRHAGRHAHTHARTHARTTHTQHKHWYEENSICMWFMTFVILKHENMST